MIDFHDLFQDFYDDPQISLTELSIFCSEVVGRMAGANPGGVFTARITALQGALSSLETNTTDAGVKLGLQKGATENKKNFRAALVGNMSRVHARVVGQYGKNSAEVLEIFPQGLAPFQKNAPEEPLENELQVVLTGVTAHQADLGAPLVEEVAGYSSAWIVVREASKGSKIAKKSSNLTGADLRKALQIEATKTVLFVAFTFPGDEAKCDFYLPQHLLRNPQQQKPPAPTLEVEFGVGQITVVPTASNADVVKVLAKYGGGEEFMEIGQVAPGATLVVSLPAGTVEVKAIATNGAGDSPESDVVSGEVT